MFRKPAPVVDSGASSLPGGGGGWFLAIGVNRLDSVHYGTEGLLAGCEGDARDMARLAMRSGYRPFSGDGLLLSEAATRSAVSSYLRVMAQESRPGDSVLIHYSGHGGQVLDYSGDESDDHIDETWCLHDGQYLDDELAAVLSSFDAGVRVVVVSDSCHSGTVSRAVVTDHAMWIASRDPRVDFSLEGHRPVYRTLGPLALSAVQDANRGFYAAVAASTPRVVPDTSEPRASILTLSACQDNQLALDGPRNGLFTGKILEALSEGAFRGSYRQLFDRVISSMPPTQTPNLTSRGPGRPAAWAAFRA